MQQNTNDQQCLAVVTVSCIHVASAVATTEHQGFFVKTAKN